MSKERQLWFYHLNGLCLDLSYGKAEAGNDVITWEYRKAINQFWIEDLEHHVIRTKADRKLVLEAKDDGRVVINTFCHGKESQQWSIQEGRICRMTDHERVLQIKDGKKNHGSTLCVANFDSTKEEQIWEAVEDEDRKLRLFCHLNNLCLDQIDATELSGSEVILGEYRNSNQQMWIEDLEHHVIRCKANRNLVLEERVDHRMIINNFKPGKETQQWWIKKDKICRLNDENQVLKIVNAEPGAKLCVAKYDKEKPEYKWEAIQVKGTQITGEALSKIVEVLAEVNKNEDSIKAIGKTTQKCIKWAKELRDLIERSSLDFVYNRETDGAPNDEFLREVTAGTERGKFIVMFFEVGKEEHVLAMKHEGSGEVCMLHTTVLDISPEQVKETVIPYNEMVEILRKLLRLKTSGVEHETPLAQIMKDLWGFTQSLTSDVVSVSRILVMKLIESPESDSKARLSDVLRLVAAWRSSNIVSISEDSKTNRDVASEKDPSFGTGLGFVLGAGGVLNSSLQMGKDTELSESVKKAVGKGIGAAAGRAVARNVAPTFARIGTSVFRANAFAGVAAFSVIAIWDVVNWQMHKITYVELRHRLAEGGAAAGFGIAGAVGAGAPAGVLAGPVGAVIGALAGGIVAGIGGLFAGRAIDNAIWDENEDAIMNSYEFFGWHEVKRNTRPTYGPEKIAEAYAKKLKMRKKGSIKTWHQICQAYLMVLLTAMYPEFKTLMQIANKLQKNESKELAIICTTVYAKLCPQSKNNSDK